MNTTSGIYTFSRLYTGNTLFKSMSLLVDNCRLYEIKDERAQIVAKYYAGDKDSFIELPGKLYRVKDETGLGLQKKTTFTQVTSGEALGYIKMNFWNTTGTLFFNNNDQFTFRQTKPKFPLLNPSATEREYLLFNDQVNMHYQLAIPFPGTYGGEGASPAHGSISTHQEKPLQMLLGIVIMEMMIRGYELNTSS